jgi:hypothetical protein
LAGREDLNCGIGYEGGLRIPDDTGQGIRSQRSDGAVQ